MVNNNMSKYNEYRKIHIQILTLDGGESKFEFNLDALVGAVKTDALAHFGMVPTPSVKYKLAKKKDDKFRTCDDAKSLGTEGIQDKDELWLCTEQLVGSK